MILNQNHNQSKYERARKSSHPTVQGKPPGTNIGLYGVKLILGETTKSIVPVLQIAVCKFSEAKIKFYMITTDEFVLSIQQLLECSIR